MPKKLVAYFSAGGVTKKVAERLAAAAGADLFEIEPGRALYCRRSGLDEQEKPQLGGDERSILPSGDRPGGWTAWRNTTPCF